MNRKAARLLAWILGLGGAAAGVFTVGAALALGLYSVHLLFYAAFIAAGLLGAVIGSRQPSNSVGWVMCAASLASILFYLPVDYAYVALVLEHGSWPLGQLALWLGAWAWVPLLGLFLPLLTVRFPDGRVPRRYRAVDWLAITGTALFAVGVALAPANVLAHFLQVPAQLRALLVNPIAAGVPASDAALITDAGVTVILAGYAAAVLSVVDRFRHARDDERDQLKWFAYAGVIVVAAEVYGASALIAGWSITGDVEVVVNLSTFALPLAVAIAILHHRLYDVDLLINRTLVYGGLTAILAASYTAGTSLLQRLFIAVSGQRSDFVDVLAAFAVVIAFSPVKDWLQAQVDRRVGGRGPAAALHQLSAQVEEVLSVIDRRRLAHRLLDEAMAAFSPGGAALYLASNGTSAPFGVRGSVELEGCLEVPLRHHDRQIGRLVLGSRRGGLGYSRKDRDVLQRSADSVAEALDVIDARGVDFGPHRATDLSGIATS